MKKNRLISLVMATSLLFTAVGCGSSSDKSADGNKATTSDGKVVERKEFNKIYSTELTTFNYLKSSLSGNTELTYLIVDGLVEFDKYGVLQPALATEWKVSEDETVYTFKLREGVKWYTADKEEYAEVVAQDFIDSMKYILTKDNASSTSNIVYDTVKGAKDYYEGKTTDFSTVGIKAIDEHTLEYTLNKPTPYFLKMLSYVCWLPVNGKFLNENGKNFGTSNTTTLYNGAYIITVNEPENRRVLEMNQNYWGKDNIYISQINYKFNKEAKALGPELFLRGETDEVTLPIEIVDEWMKDPTKKEQMHKRPMTSYSYFYGFNFEPLYEAEYGPENWKKAVNNKDFRKSLFHAVDRVSALMTLDPYEAPNRTNNTITKPGFLYANGTDYVKFPELKKISETDTFNEKTALDYKEKAKKELAGSVTFPVKVVMPYSTGDLNLTNRVQVVEQQMEKLLGQDYIDIVLVPYPASGYNKAARSSGKFSMLEINWGPDYADPASYHDVMVSSTNIGKLYSRPWMATEYKEANGLSKYENMLNQGKAENTDLTKRYDLLSKAEAYLIEEALVLPFYISGGGFMASKLDPFSGNCSQFGRNANNLKGKIVLDKSMGLEEYEKAEKTYNEERDAAIKKAQENQKK